MYKEPDADEDSTCKACKTAKAVAQVLVNDSEDDLAAGTDTGKDKSGESATFGNNGSNQYKESRR